MGGMSPSPRAARWLFALALLLLVLAEILRVYWIMPFPGSQSGATLAMAYALHRGIFWLRLVLVPLVLVAALLVFRGSGKVGRALAALGLAAAALIAWQTNGPMSADVIFLQPKTITLGTAAKTAAKPETLVVGVALAGAESRSEARAYPVNLIGYHHQVRDTVAGVPILVTYCTVCRTGRVFSPVVDGKAEEFRLVGMDNWNAMFEDGSTGSWWRQASGQAVAGPRQGAWLAEVASRQMTWQAWLALHPDSTILEPDPAFAETYAGMEGYAEGTRGGKLTGRDPASWQEKSWVVGVVAGKASRAFDWNELAEKKVLADPVGEVPAVVLLGADGASFYAYDARRPAGGPPVELERVAPGKFRDRASGSLFGENGKAADGPLIGLQLLPLPAYQEFWHSWRTFHPETTTRR